MLVGIFSVVQYLYAQRYTEILNQYRSIIAHPFCTMSVVQDAHEDQMLENHTELYLLKSGTSGGKLLQIGNRKNICDDVVQAVCMGHGIAVLTEDNILSYYSDGKATQISNDVSSLCWNGEKLVYYDYARKAFFAWSESSMEVLTDYHQDYGIRIISNSDYLIVLSINGKHYSYHYATETWKPIAWNVASHEDCFILLDRYLIAIGWFSTGGEVYDLSEDKVIPIEMGWDGTERTTAVSMAFTEEKIYVSIKSEKLPQFKSDPITQTVEITPHTWEVRQLDSSYHPILMITDDILYGSDMLYVKEIADIS